MYLRCQPESSRFSQVKISAIHIVFNSLNFFHADIAGELMWGGCMAKIRDSVQTAISLPCAANGLAAMIDANCNIQRSDHAQKSVDPLRLRRYFHRIIRTKTCVAAGTRSSDLAAFAERGAGSFA